MLPVILDDIHIFFARLKNNGILFFRCVSPCKKRKRSVYIFYYTTLRFLMLLFYCKIR